MKRQWAVLAAGAMLGSTLLTAGCMERQGDIGNINLRKQSVSYEKHRLENGRLNSNNLMGLHRNHRMEMSQEISDKITSMKEVDGAFVMLTDQNAYVAVTTKSERGTKAQSRPLSRTKSSLLPQESNYNIRKSYGMTSIHGVPENRAQPSAKDYDMLGTRAIDSTRSYDETKTHSNRPYYAHQNQVYHQHADVPSERAIDRSLKDRIANEVKRMAPQIQHVYVSANPDFVSRMTGYMEDVRQGHPISGFIVEFNAMVERIFPAKSGTSSQ
ncbi:YhcN/YlaJ family sporulation lipoprotein [Paenibacillus sp. GCM10027626]|uniref:YhcN/YlaJ family sporulation lipoprotein n=1 Tax=Paenibacillus sp. GCM10027626 TaxID=3273411 RepID=UPI003645480D